MATATTGAPATGVPTATTGSGPGTGASVALPLQEVRAAAARTLAVPTSWTLDFAGLSTKPITGSGSFDFSAGTGRERLLHPTGDELVVFEPTIVYDRPPPKEAFGLPRGRTWIAAEPAERVTAAPSFGQFVVQVEGRNPTFLLAEAAWGVQSARPLGQRVVGRSKATEYLVSVDLAGAAAGVSGSSAKSFAGAIAFETRDTSSSGPRAAPLVSIRIWVDAAGRVVQLRSSPPGSGAGTATMTVSRFGVRVDPKRPSNSEIIDLARLLPGSDTDRD